MAPPLVAVRNDCPLGSPEIRGAIAKAFDTYLLVAKITYVGSEGEWYNGVDLDLDFKTSDFHATYSQCHSVYVPRNDIGDESAALTYIQERRIDSALCLPHALPAGQGHLD